MNYRNNSSSDYESRAERNPRLKSLFERTLSKFNANTPQRVEVVENEPPRKGVLQFNPKARK